MTLQIFFLYFAEFFSEIGWQTLVRPGNSATHPPFFLPLLLSPHIVVAGRKIKGGRGSTVVLTALNRGGGGFCTESDCVF